jgi:stage II sporulation protein D
MLINYPRSIILIMALVANLHSQANDIIRVGLLSLNSPRSLTVTVIEGNYELLAGRQSIVLYKDNNILINRAGNKILVSTGTGNTMLVDSVVLQFANTGSYFSIRNNNRADEPREYAGNLIVKPDIESLLAINEVDTDIYLAGVVQSEAGLNGNIEYFKTQTLLARTYLYMNIKRHTLDGYQVCDRTHCQAYNGRSELEIINQAVHATEDQVLVNNDSLLVVTPFHSNCGGQTESSGNVWLTSMPHLSGVIDPYCSSSSNARWVKKISIQDWISYLSKYGYHHKNNDVLVFEQLGRKREYTAGSFSYPLTRLREDWNLKSSFFSVSLDDSTVILTGKGYGHGVGLCQEGARVMTERGFKMKEIIDFYFNRLLIMDVDDVKPRFEISSAF